MRGNLLLLVAILLAAYHFVKDAPKSRLLYPIQDGSWTQTLAEWSSALWFTSLVKAAVEHDVLMFAATWGMFVWNAWKGNRAGDRNMVKVWVSCLCGMTGNAVSMIAKSMGIEWASEDSSYVLCRFVMIYLVIMLWIFEMAVLRKYTQKTVACFALVSAFAWFVLDIALEQFFQNILVVIFAVKIIESDVVAHAVCSQIIAFLKANITVKICYALVVTFVLVEVYRRGHFCLQCLAQYSWQCVLDWLNYAIANCTLAALVKPFRMP